MASSAFVGSPVRFSAAAYYTKLAGWLSESEPTAVPLSDMSAPDIDYLGEQILWNLHEWTSEIEIGQRGIIYDILFLTSRAADMFRSHRVSLAACTKRRIADYIMYLAVFLNLENLPQLSGDSPTGLPLLNEAITWTLLNEAAPTMSQMVDRPICIIDDLGTARHYNRLIGEMSDMFKDMRF